MRLSRKLLQLCKYGGALAFATTFSSGPSTAAQVAASVEYETVAAPTSLPANAQPSIGLQYMKALPGSTLTYLNIKTVDGYKMLAALWRPINKPIADTTMIISVHGGGNDFTQVPVRALGIRLSPKGYAVLAANDQQSGSEKQNHDNFFDISTDIDAVVKTAKAMGYRKILIHGQSMGTQHAIYYAATHWDSAIKGVILTAASADGPWHTRNTPEQSEDGITVDNYDKVRKAAHDALKVWKLADSLSVDKQVSAQHFLTYQDDLSSAAVSAYWIRRIPYPILNLRDQADSQVHPYDAEWLLHSAQDEGSLVPEYTFQVVPDSGPPSKQGHTFYYNTDAYIGMVSKWLSTHHL